MNGGSLESLGYMKIKTEHNTVCSPNPKDEVGSNKVPMSLVPAIAIAHEACAMLHGAEKYGQWNWRHHPVQANIYLDALSRHVAAWQEGEDLDQESGIHHLGHARACLGILLDAWENGNLIDNRPPASCFPEALAELNNWVRNMKEGSQVEYEVTETGEQAIKDLQDYIDRAGPKEF